MLEIEAYQHTLRLFECVVEAIELMGMKAL